MCIKEKEYFIDNDKYVGVLFVISVVINLHGHRFEENTLVPKIHDNMDMVMGIKNVYEIEGVISTRDL